MSSQSKAVGSGNINNNRYNEAEAKYPAFIAVYKRHESFAVWPNQNELQCAKNMALAGFYYIGSADRARCFYCGLTLRDWDEEDEPFSVHKQWSPNCGYISHIAEQQLSSGIQSLHVTPSVSHDSNPTIVANGFSSNSSNQGLTTPDARAENVPISRESSFGASSNAVHVTDGRTDPETLPTRVWEHPPHVQALLDMGYNLEDVRQANDRRRQAGEDDFTDASSLLRAVEGWM